MTTAFKIQEITFDLNFIYLLIDGKLNKIALDKASKKLKTANDMEKNLFKISPSGYGIHWPLIDEDLSIEALLKHSE
jgi:Protein of unknown function (DUF2442)